MVNDRGKEFIKAFGAPQTAAERRQFARDVLLGRKQAEQKQFVSGVGGIGAPSPTAPPVTRGDSQRRIQISSEIQKETSAKIMDLRKRFQRDSARADRNTRLELLKKFQEDRGKIVLLSQLQRVEAGISQSAKFGEIKVTKDTAKSLSDALQGKQITAEEVRKLERAGVEFEAPKEPIILPTFPEGEAIPQRVTVGGEIIPTAVPRRVDLEFTPGEATRGILKLPLEIIRDISFSTGKASEKIAEVAGIPTITKVIPATPVAQKVTIGGEFVIPEVEVELLSPKQIGSTVDIGTQLALLAATPGLVIAPGFVVEGTETALNEKFTKAQRLLGVVEAEAGLLIGGLSFLSLLDDIGLANSKISIREFEVIKGKRARVGKATKQKQIQVQKNKKAKAKANVKDLKDAIKRANSEELRIWRQRQRELILGNTKTTQAEKDQLILLLDSTILEAKTGKAIILEGGVVDLRLLGDALRSARSKVVDLVPKGRFEALGIPKGRFVELGIPKGRFVGLGMPKGRFKPLGVIEGRIPILKSELEKRFGSAKNVQRVLEARAKNRLRIRDAQKPFADRIKDAVKTPSALRGLERSLSANLSRQKNLSRNISLLRSRLESATTTLQKESLKSQQKNLLKLASLLKTKQKQLQRQRSGIRQRLRRSRRVREPKPKLKPLILFPKPKLEGVAKAIKKKKIKRGTAFDVFVRKQKKDVLFKSFKSKKKARTALKKRLSSTLRASGFIVDKGGRRLTPKVSKGFRLSKTRKNVLVEKRGRRLDTKSEVKALQLAKKGKKPFKPDKNSFKIRRKKR